MPYKEITLTKHLLSSRITKLKKAYEEHRTTKPTSSIMNRNNVKKLEKMIGLNVILCNVCNKNIDSSHIGQKIVTTDNRSRFIKHWQHLDCAKEKNLI